MPRVDPSQAAKRFVQWLDDLKSTHALKPYPSAEAVAARLQKTNPLLRGDRAAWLARQWARPASASADARRAWELLADPAHKRSTPVLYHVEEVLEIWKLISAPVLWVEGDQTDIGRWWGKPLHEGRVPRAPEGRRPGREARALAGRPHAAPRPAGAACDPPRCLSEWVTPARGLREKIGALPLRTESARHGRRTHQCDRQLPRRPDPADRIAPGVSLTTIAKRCD